MPEEINEKPQAKQERSRTKAFFINSVSAAVLQIITFVSGIIVPRLFLQYYGSEINGLVTSITQFIQYFALVEAGISSASVAALFKPLANNDQEKVNGIMAATQKFYLRSGLLFVCLVLGLAFAYPFFVNTTAISRWPITYLVIIVSANRLVDFFTIGKYSSLLRADQREFVISLAGCVSTIINILLVWFLAPRGMDIVLLKLVCLSSVISRTIVIVVYSRVHYKKLNTKVEPDYKAVNTRWAALLIQLLGVVQTASPAVILTIETRNLTLVSIYTVYAIVPSGLSGVMGIFSSGLSSSFGDLLAKKQDELLKKAYTEFECMYYVINTIVYSTALIMIMPFITLYTDGIKDANYIIPLFGYLIILNAFINNLKTPQGMMIFSAGLFKETLWQTGIQAAIIIIISVATVPFIGLYGVIAGGLASNVYRCIDLAIFIPKHVTKTSIWDSFKRMLISIAATAIAVVPSFFIHLHPDGYLVWVLYAIVCVLYCTAINILIWLLLDRKALVGSFRRLVTVFKRHKEK
jgi:O-antigen/teichoic acid export membrane protein